MEKNLEKYNETLQALNAVHYLLHCSVEFSEDIKIVLCRVAQVISDSLMNCLTDCAVSNSEIVKHVGFTKGN